MNRTFAMCLSLVSLGCLPMVLAGCGGGGGGGGATARTTVVLSGASDDAARLFSFSGGTRGTVNPSEVDPADIESLTLTLTEIIFLYEGPDDGEDEEEDGEDVDVLESSFDPTTVSIEEGETVRWEWEVNGLHTITSGSVGDPDAGSLFDETQDTEGDVVEIVFFEAGTYPYFSNTETDIANAMTGTVIVEEESSESEGGEPEVRGVEDPDDEEEDDDDDTRHITVFSGSMDIDIISLSLLDLASLITEITLPAGEYKGIRLHIENPRLVLKADPATVITDVHLTANGRLFIKHEFELGAGEDVIVTIFFGDIHLVDTGSDKYVLTPQMRLSDDEESTEVEFEGTIASIADDRLSMVVDLNNGFTSITVLLDNSPFIHEDDSETPLTVGDLAIGMEVEVEGTANGDGTVTAEEVEIDDGEIEFHGEITSIAGDKLSMQVMPITRTESVTVHLDQNPFIHESDSETPLTVDALSVGQHVEVEGTENSDNSVTASEVEIEDTPV